VSGEKSNFTHDFFISFGIKAFKYTEYDVVTPAGLNANPVYQKSTSGTVSAKVLPALNMGYAFGFGF